MIGAIGYKILDMMYKRIAPEKEEEPMSTLLGVPITGINANTSTVTTTLYPTQYAGFTSAQNVVGGNYPLTGIFGGAVGGAGGAGGAAQVNAVYGQAYYTPQAGYNSYVLPMMSGVLVSIAFTDASGATYAVTIDQAYVQILQDISRNIQMTYGNQHTHLQQSPYAGQPHLKMLEGDFSEEEMTEAEGIIAELEGKSGSEAPHP